MSQLYVWKSQDLAPAEARQRFTQRLEGQTELYNRYLSTNCTFRFTQCGDVFVGQISSRLGIQDWRPWSEGSGVGVAWAGVCEDFLGATLDQDALQALVADLIARPQRLSELCGGFSVCAWDDAAGSVNVATGSTQHQTLWETSGPEGFALGSRARPILDLVGRPAELDPDEASAFIAYKYLLGRGSLFKNVHRMHARQRVLFVRGQSPSRATYQTLGEYLGEPEPLPFDEAVERCAVALKNRVTQQVRASENPVLNLTGGRDSRCIAAALRHTSFRGPASTGGSPSSADVIVASRVADVLGFAHVRSAGVAPAELLARLDRHRDRAHVWIALSEGVATIKHGLHRAALFESEAPYPSDSAIEFNGHHAGLEKYAGRRFTPERINANVGPHLARLDAVRERFEDTRESLNAELRSLAMPASRWPEMYYWQRHALQWGQDNLLVGDLFAWNWTPLFDRTLIRTGWFLPNVHRGSTEFVEALATELAPALQAVAYEDAIANKTLVARLIAYGSRKGRLLIGRPAPSRPKTRRARGPGTEQALWERVLFRSDHAEWRSLISPEFVWESIDGMHPGETHWSVATVQLFVESGL